MLEITEIFDHETKIKYILLAEFESHESFLPLTLSLICQDNNSVFCTKFLSEDLEKLKIESKFNTDEYIRLTQSSLMGFAEKETFFYEIREKSISELEFTWKYLLSDAAKVKLGSLVLKKDNEYDAFSIMKYIALEMKKIEKQNTQLIKEQSILKDRVNQLLNSLENFQISKEEFENEMYKKFVSVINNMKDKHKKLKSKMDSSVNKSDSAVPGSSTSHSEDKKVHKIPKTLKNVSYFDSEEVSIPEPSDFKRQIPKNRYNVKPTSYSKKISHAISSSDESYNSDSLMDEMNE